VKVAKMRVGFIGLGSQGGPMARRIAESGVDTVLWARRPERLRAFEDTGATFAESPEDLAKLSELICVCVVNDGDVAEVYGQMERALSPGKILAIHSTVHPSTCRDLAAKAADQGVTVIDAPVSGSGASAAAGTLLVMMGGDEAVCERVRPVFETYGNPVVRVGDVGAGQLAKLVNNASFIAGLTLAQNALDLGSTLGIEREALVTVMNSGSGGSYAFGILSQIGLETLGASGAPLLRKDIDILASVAKERNVETGRLVDVANVILRRMGY
jgi:3-hydroxyisobutyrate dehydrogenase